MPLEMQFRHLRPCGHWPSAVVSIESPLSRAAQHFGQLEGSRGGGVPSHRAVRCRGDTVGFLCIGGRGGRGSSRFCIGSLEGGGLGMRAQSSVGHRLQGTFG